MNDDTKTGRRVAQRKSQRERALMGETMKAFHDRETAPPPTLTEIYDRNHKDRERCPDTIDLFDGQ